MTLPDYFQAINRDFHYQLTAIGAPAPNLHVAREIADNEFLIAGPRSGSELVEALAAEGVLAGVPAGMWGGSWPDGMLTAVTECNTAEDIDAFLAALERVS